MSAPDAELVARQVGTEHYEAVLHCGDMARVMPQLVWHLEDLRAGTCYQNFYVARLASRFTKVVLAGHRRRRAVRRLPVALRAPRRRRATAARSSTPTTTTGAGWCRDDQQAASLFTDAALGRAPQGAASPRDRFERGDRRTSPSSSRSTWRSTSSNAPSCTACSWSRTSSRWRTGSRRAFRSSTTSWWTSRCASPGASKRLERGQEASARCGARTAARRAGGQAQAGFQPPGPAPGTSGRNLSYVREVLLDSAALGAGPVPARISWNG